MIYRELLLGCGYRRLRLLDPYDITHRRYDGPERWTNVIGVDINRLCKPDYVMDLEKGLFVIGLRSEPPSDPELFQPDVYADRVRYCRFRDDLFDEVHAYEVLEHLGSQGDVHSFFRDFDEIWRVLKPGGYLCASVPSRYSSWLWGDPGHRRAILPETLMFLNRPFYDNAPRVSPSSDYRSHFISDWDIKHSHDNQESHNFILQAVKPPRPPQ